ncbi:hypothetical protein [Methylobacter sp.]|uniref:hypothetical protein n=1 Tax=Methylobacter sp. TaxID=2051955 RepID=UPI002FDD1276
MNINYWRAISNKRINKNTRLPIDWDRTKELSTLQIHPYIIDKKTFVVSLQGVFQGILDNKPKFPWAPRTYRDPRVIMLDCATGLLVWFPYDEVFSNLKTKNVWPGDSITITYELPEAWKVSQRRYVQFCVVAGGGFLPDNVDNIPAGVLLAPQSTKKYEAFY